MVLHAGEIYQDGDVTLRPPPEAMRAAIPDTDDEDAAHWWLEAEENETVYYFSVFHGETLVGQILLHDIDAATGEALIAYHIFRVGDRGRGIGTRMLNLLKQYVVTETKLRKLIIITSRDNLASQRIAQKCGFEYAGASREDPVNGMVFQWEVASRFNEENK